MPVRLSDISFSYGGKPILNNLSASLGLGERVALIGPNGSGKSTLLDIIAGRQTADSGRVEILPHIRTGYLRQASGSLPLEGSIESIMRQAMARVFELEVLLEQLRQNMALTPAESPEYSILETQYQKAEDEFRSLDGYQAEVKINQILTGLGFGTFGRAVSVQSLSGGEAARLMLCSILARDPDLLILDEATNHLDFKMLAWLEDYLAGFRGAVLTVSHDRFFLDRVTSVTWELEQGGIVRYNAPYSRYLTLRHERIERLEKEYEFNRRRTEKLADYAARNRERASTAALARSRQRMLERLDDVEKPPAVQRAPKISFAAPARSGQTVLQVKGITVSVGQSPKRRLLMESLSFEVRRTDRLAIVGPNGAGKSSLMLALIGRLLPESGEIIWGGKTKIGFFSQAASEFDPNKEVARSLMDAFPHCSRFEILSRIAGLGLTQEDASKKVGMLSGGEYARLKLARLILEEPNVLLLDEPTNHLDILSREALDRALESFEGTIIIISHDRWLLSRIAAQVLWLEGDGSFAFFPNGLEELTLALKEREALPSRNVKAKGKANTARRIRRERSLSAANKHNAASLEEEIFKHESELAEICCELESPLSVLSHDRLFELTDRLACVQAALDKLYESWHSALEAFDKSP